MVIKLLKINSRNILIIKFISDTGRNSKSIHWEEKQQQQQTALTLNLQYRILKASNAIRHQN